MKKRVVDFMKMLAVGICLVVLPGCRFLEWFKGKVTTPVTFDQVAQEAKNGKKDDGEVLALVAGKPVMTTAKFEEHLSQMLKAYPQLQGAISPSALPLGLRKAVLNKLVEQEVILAWAEKNNVDQDPDFQKKYQETVANVRKLLFAQHLEKQILDSVEASDREVRDEYEKNKKRYIKSMGGVLVSGISFEKEADTAAFLAKAKGKPDEFVKLAKEEKTGKFRSFGRVREDSPMVPEAIRTAALKVRKFPAIERVTVDKVFWVTYASDPKKDEYSEFDEVKGQIENMIRMQKFQKAFSEKMEAIKSEMGVEIRESILGEEEPKEAVMPSESQEKETVEGATVAKSEAAEAGQVSAELEQEDETLPRGAAVA